MALTTNSRVWHIMLLVFLFLTAFFTILFYFEDLFIVLIVGSILVLVTDQTIIGFNKKFEKKSRWKKRMYAVLLVSATCIVLYLLILGQLADITSLLNSQEEYQSYITTLFSSYGGIFLPQGEPGNSTMANGPSFRIFGEDMQSVGDYLFTLLSSMISRLSYFIFTGLLIIPLMFRLYFSKKHVILDEIIDHVPVTYQDCVQSSIIDIGEKLRDFFSAKILESFIVGIICCAGFYLAGINGWFFLGALAGFLNIVPYIGPIIGSIPAIIVGLMVSPATAVFALITVIIAQLVDNLYLIPFMISGKVHVSPLLSIILILIFADILGPLGMILAIPIYIVYKIVLTEFYYELIKIYPDDSRHNL